MKIIETIESISSGNFNQEYICGKEYYDEENQFVKSEKYHSSGNLELEKSFTYSQESEQTTEDIIYHHPLCVTPNTISHFRQQRLIKVIEKYTKSDIEITFEYDINNQLIRKNWNRNGIIFKYEENQYLHDKIKTTTKIEKNSIQELIEFDYDSSNRLIEKKTTSYPDKDILVEKYIYLEKNLIELQWIENGNLEFVERTILDEFGNEQRVIDGNIIDREFIEEKSFDKTWDTEGRLINEKTVFEGEIIYEKLIEYLPNGLKKETEWHEEYEDLKNVKIIRIQKVKRVQHYN